MTRDVAQNLHKNLTEFFYKKSKIISPEVDFEKLKMRKTPLNLGEKNDNSEFSL